MCSLPRDLLSSIRACGCTRSSPEILPHTKLRLAVQDSLGDPTIQLENVMAFTAPHLMQRALLRDPCNQPVHCVTRAGLQANGALQELVVPSTLNTKNIIGSTGGMSFAEAIPSYALL